MRKLVKSELQTFAGHVRYEKDMWDWTIENLGSEVPDGPFHNAMVEVFILHSRALVEFAR
jgi:hypothetical protein